MMNSLALEPKPKSREARERIVRYLTEGDIKLKPAEQAILSRWEKADLLLRQQAHSWEEIVTMISEECQVSRQTADNDISAAQAVFARSRKINRKYLGHLHLERIERMIRKVEKYFYTVNEEGYSPTPASKDMIALAKLYESYTYQLNSLPSDVEYKPILQPIFMFKLAGDKDITPPMSFTDALQRADEIIDIPHDDVTRK